MQVELRCAACRLCFPWNLDTAAIDRLSDEGPWSALGDGETFEDRIHADLLAELECHCPRCGSPVSPTEESLGELASELLTHW
jgi:hypothetical protein